MLDRGLKVEITENSGYFSCLFLWALFSVLTKSTLSECFLGIYTLNRLVFYASIIIVCIRYISFIRGRESRTILISLLIIISSIMGMYYSGREEIFILALFVVGAVDIDIEYAIKWLFYGELIGTIIVVFLSSTGIIENYIYTAERGTSYVTRYSMGFAHPNTFAIIAFQLMICIIYLRRKRTGLLGNFILIISAYILYSITYSRTIFFVTLGIAFYNIVGIFAERFQGNAFWNFLGRSMARLLIVVGCFGSIYVAMTYSLGNALIELITNYETSRPMLISEAFNYYDFTLFGQEVNLISSSEINEVVGAYAVLDNAYIFLILEFGVINTIWVVGLYLLGIRKMRNSDFQDYRIETLTLSIVGYLFIAITEKYTFDLFYNYTLFIIAYQLYGATYVSDDESEYLFEEKA